jgi:ABC-2 type transport system permease protein
LSYLGTLTRTRVRLALRNRMFYFFSVFMPLGFFFLWAGVFAKGVPRAVQFFLGPVLALNVMGSFWGLSATLVTFREQGILRRFHVTPVTASDMLASSVLANFSLTIPVVVLELILARLVFHVPSLGDPLTIFVMVAVGTISFGALGLVVASITNTMQETQVLNQLLWLPMLFFSGATLPIGYLSKYVQHIALFLPATYMVSALQNGIYFGQAVWRLPVQLFSLVAWAALSFFASVQLFRWEPESKIPRNAKLLAAATVIPFILLGVYEQGNSKILKDAQTAWESVNAPDRQQTRQPDARP